MDRLCIFIEKTLVLFCFFFITRNHLTEELGLRKHEIFPISLSNLFSSISNLTSRQSLDALRISNSSGRKRERKRGLPFSSLSQPPRLIPHSPLVSILTRRIKWKRGKKKEAVSQRISDKRAVSKQQVESSLLFIITYV